MDANGQRGFKFGICNRKISIRAFSLCAGSLLTMMLASTTHASEDIKLANVEKYTIVYEVSGEVMQGTRTLHVRDWGKLTADFQDVKQVVAGFKQPVPSTRTINDFREERIITISEATGTTTISPMPLFLKDQKKVGSLASDSNRIEAVHKAMGGTATGKNGAFAGHDCAYWDYPQLFVSGCMTEWGGAVHTINNFDENKLEMTAVEVRLGDGGPDEAFAYDLSNATDMGEMRKQMMSGPTPEQLEQLKQSGAIPEQVLKMMQQSTPKQ